MDLDQARRVVRETPIYGQPTHHFDDHAWDRAFDAAADHLREPYRDAMVVFFDEGTSEEQQQAQWFFVAHGVGAREAARLAELYAARGWDSRHPAAGALARAGRLIGGPGRDALLRLFVADPRKHHLLAKVVLKEGGAPAWEAFASMVRATDDVAVLREAFDATVVPSLERPFYEVVGEKSEPAIRALAAALSCSGDELLRACLPPPGPRLDRRTLELRLGQGKACLVEPAFGALERGDRFALYVEGPQVKVVHYDPKLDRVRRLERRPREEMGTALDRVAGAAVPEARLALLDRLRDPLFAAVAVRERREEELRGRLEGGTRWLALGGSAKVTTYLRHGAPGWCIADCEGLQPLYGRFVDEAYLGRLFDAAIYREPSRDASPLTDEELRRWAAADTLFAATVERIQAGTVAVRWGGADEIGPSWAHPDAPRWVAARDGALSEVELTGSRARLVKPLDVQWSGYFRDCLLGLAARGALPERLAELG